ncbi:MAG: phosphatidic acid phosphatase [Sphingobacteriales bacterium 50-39]|nr:vanadium-dependent haloperoxidase [Sphingobacteriales bacterium]OJW59435.1 MAG: phosphatidic acid phosphatase [Sphingobacteriales bacterium 50-39]
MKILAYIVVCLNTFSVLGADAPGGNTLHRAEKALTDVIVHDIFSPPVASRIYLYANVAAYETLVKAYPGDYRSLHGQVKAFPDLPAPQEKIDGGLSAVYAFLLVGKKLVFSEGIMEDSIRSIVSGYRGLSRSVYDASLRYGKRAADSIIAWADRDQYKETRKLPRYRFIKKEGKWIPTPPAYMAAIEPYWNRIRTVTLDSCSQFRPAGPPPFSKDTGSIFYQQAYDVYVTGNKLTQEQKDIANFWDCNPFAVTMEGHLNYAVKKISPGGHWMSIVGIVTRQKGASMLESSAVYTMASIALFDAFIACWDEKYRSNVIRPETYIDAYINEGWRPLLQTPPFPEYVSGHSIISQSTAVVLSGVLGDQVAFDDSTEVEFGLPVRHFSSFLEAAQEAAESRFYGGIHYRAAIEGGLVSGDEIGRWVLHRIRLRH